MTDGAAFLSDGARRSLDAELEDYQRRTGHHLLVWIGRTTDGVPVEDFAVRAFEAWRVGRKGVDDGLVLFVFPEDRKVRIEVGYGLEGQVPDAIASRIIREEIVPRIRAGDRDGAILAGVAGLVGAIDGPSPALEPGPGGLPRGDERPARGPRALSTAEKIVVGLVVVWFLILLVTNPSLAIYLLFSILSGGRGGGGFGGRAAAIPAGVAGRAAEEPRAHGEGGRMRPMLLTRRGLLRAIDQAANPGGDPGGRAPDLRRDPGLGVAVLLGRRAEGRGPRLRDGSE